MRIIQLHAENFKRLGVVEIEPSGNLIKIGGKNGHGKSSVLDAIYVALRGRAVAPPKPIRAGEEKCTIRLDLGDIVVTRNFHQKAGLEYTDTLKVENADGLRYSKPDAILRSLLGEIGFDPFEFVNLKPKEQVARLLDMVPLSIDLDEFAQADASDFAKRTEANRDVARLKANVDAIPEEAVPADAPDRDALLAALGKAADTNGQINAERQRREQERGRVDKFRSDASALATRIDNLKREIAAAEEAQAAQIEGADALEKELDELPPLAEFVDTDALREQISAADQVAATMARQERRAGLVGELTEAQERAEGLTLALAGRAKQRNEALAEAEMPVEGLSFAIDEAGAATLMWEGLPFDKDQISTAAQLRVSTAIGMAANPRLRVLRIMDGSLLDEDSMAMLAEMAEAEDFQLWVEVVGDGGVGIIMENGLIKGAGEPEPEAAAGEDAKPKPKAKAAPKAGEEKLL